ncbi:MAG: hypothetical protein RLZZ164_714 [Actinomycetota bacterium]
MQLTIEADGGSRGNPGTAGSGAVVLSESGEVLREIARYVGIATNNVAEYTGLIAGLQAAIEIDPSASIHVRMDSKLVIEQMGGGWKLKHPDMISLGAKVQELVRGRTVTWQWIPREQNSRADALANKAMDEQSDSTVVPGSPSTADQKKPAALTEFNLEGPSSVRAPGLITEPLTTLVLVRHGRTALTEAHKISGGDGDDPELSDAGLQDAAAVAKLLASFGKAGRYAHIAAVDSVVASPMNRTRQTGEAIAAATGASFETLEGIREIGFGDWDGRSSEEIAVTDAESWNAWRGSWEIAPPNGESLETFDARLQRARREIVAKHSGKTVAVVAHVMPIRGFLKHAFDAGTAGYWRPQVAPCSVTIIRVWGDQAAEVVAVNITEHL